LALIHKAWLFLRIVQNCAAFAKNIEVEQICEHTTYVSPFRSQRVSI
jgi:hypothetical protein